MVYFLLTLVNVIIYKKSLVFYIFIRKKWLHTQYRYVTIFVLLLLGLEPRTPGL